MVVLQNYFFVLYWYCRYVLVVAKYAMGGLFWHCYNGRKWRLIRFRRTRIGVHSPKIHGNPNSSYIPGSWRMEAQIKAQWYDFAY
eukprot:scaffold5067_cov161-Skeletonema_menzelii.AAC.24